MVDVEDEPCLETAVGRLTDTEQEIIAQVLARDEEMREIEELRLSRLNLELTELREKGVPEGHEDEYGRVCMRCRAPLGLFVNSGSLCSHCARKICRDCRRTYNNRWLCVVCYKEREVKAESGAWFYDNFARKGKRVYGSALLKRIFRKLEGGGGKQDYRKKDMKAMLSKMEDIGAKILDDPDDLYRSTDSAKARMENERFSEEPTFSGILKQDKFATSKSSVAYPEVTENEPGPVSQVPESIFDKKNPFLDDEEELDENNYSVVKKTVEITPHFQHKENEEKRENYDRHIKSNVEDVAQRRQIEYNEDGADELADECSERNISAILVSEGKILSDTDVEIVETITVDNDSAVEGNEVTETYDDENEKGAGVLGANGTAVGIFMEPEMITNVGRGDSILSETSHYDDEGFKSPKVKGEILLGMKYGEAERKFEVQIHKVRDLPAADTRKNTTDPYVKVYLLPDKSNLGKRKTKAKKHSLNPEFDEILTYKISYEELILKKLWVSVWHHSIGHNLFLGEVQIDIDGFLQSGFSLSDPIPQWYTLTGRTFTRAELEDVGDIRLSLKYVPPGSITTDQIMSRAANDPTSGVLLIKVVSAKNLKGFKAAGHTNSYVKFALLSDAVRTKSDFYSTTPMGTTNPHWDQEFSIVNVSWNNLHKSVLEVTVNEHESSSRQESLGCCRLGLGLTDNELDDPFGPECAIWKTMLDNPNEWNSVTIPLRSTTESLKQDTSGPPVHIKRIPEESLHKKDSRSDIMGSFEDIRPEKKKSFLKYPDQHSLSSFGSMLSIYSDAGGHGALEITGDVLFSIKYDDMAGVFEIAIVKAKNIAIANNKTRSSDPYVKTYLLPDKSKSSKKKSSVRRRTVNPEWDESIKYKIGQDDLMKRTLQLSLWNYDKFGQNDFLGEVQVQIQNYVKSGHSLNDPEPVWYTLQDSAPVSIGQPGFQGDLTVAVKYETENEKLIIDVRSAKGLPGADPAGKSNPFVKSYLLPDKTRKSKRKTKVVKKTLDPQWNEKIEYAGITLDDLETRVLELTVWDQEKRENIFLGGSRIGLASGDEYWHDCSGKEVELWRAVLDHPNIWNEYEVPLRDSMTSRKGMDISPPVLQSYVSPEAPVKPKAPMKPEAPVKPEVDTSLSEIPPISHTAETTAPREIQMASLDKIESRVPAIRIGLGFFSPDDNQASAAGCDEPLKYGLKVHLKEGRHFPPCNDGLLPNTVCKCFVTGKRKSGKKRTDAYLRASEPSWDTELCFEGHTLKELRPRGFEIQIWNENDGKLEYQLGFVRLSLGKSHGDWDDSKEREVFLWKSMLENPGKFTYAVIPLREPENRQHKAAARADSHVNMNEVAVVNEHEILMMQKEEIERKKRADVEKSPKELALEAMGSSASDVLMLLESQKKSPEPPKERKTPDLDVSMHYGYDSPGNLALSPIQEEIEEIEVERPRSSLHKVRFGNAAKKPDVALSKKEDKTVVAPTDIKPPTVPDVVVTRAGDEVRQGDPPFKSKQLNDYDWDDEDEKTGSILKKTKKEKKKKKLMTKPGFGSQESLGSIQSTKSDDFGVYGNVTVRGELQLGLLYSYGGNALHVFVYQARNVAAVNTLKNTSDVYAKLYLMPDKTKSTKKKTRVKKNTLNPEWNELVEYKISLPELRTRVLLVQLWNRDRLSRNDFLGELQFAMFTFIDSRILYTETPTWYTLKEKSLMLEPARHKGTLNLTLKFEDESLMMSSKNDKENDQDDESEFKKKKKKKIGKSKLVVNILDAVDLPAGDKDGYSDPYCKCQMMPMKGKTQRKTHTIRHTLNPSWDYRTEYRIDQEDLGEQGLEICIFDWDAGSKDDFLGCVRLNLGEKNCGWDDAEGKELEAWQLLIAKPNKVHEVSLPVRSSREYVTLKDLEKMQEKPR